jgi:hypothetical protein
MDDYVNSCIEAGKIPMDYLNYAFHLQTAIAFHETGQLEKANEHREVCLKLKPNDPGNCNFDKW